MYELMNLSPEMPEKVERAVAANGGNMLVIVHTADMGIDEQEWQELRLVSATMLKVESQRLLVDESILVAKDQEYFAKLKQFLAGRPDRFGVVVESVAQDHRLGTVSTRLQTHVDFLRQLDPVASRGEREWIVVPTCWGNVFPIRGIERAVEIAVANPQLKAAVEEAVQLGLERLTEELFYLGIGDMALDVANESLDETIETIAALGVREIELGGCFLLVDHEDRPVNPDRHFSCINRLGKRIYDSGLFQDVRAVDQAAYVLKLLPP